MQIAKKATKTFSLDREVLADIRRTKGSSSESERVNSLLRVAMDLERREALDREAAAFFGTESTDREERRAFESASAASWKRE
jgi:hypothetical protein